MWIMGPSGPTGRPEPTASAQERNLTSSVLMLNTLGRCTPFRNAIISGTPEPPAVGATCTTSAADATTMSVLCVEPKERRRRDRIASISHVHEVACVAERAAREEGILDQ